MSIIKIDNLDKIQMKQGGGVFNIPTVKGVKTLTDRVNTELGTRGRTFFAAVGSSTSSDPVTSSDLDAAFLLLTGTSTPLVSDSIFDTTRYSEWIWDGTDWIVRGGLGGGGTSNVQITNSYDNNLDFTNNGDAVSIKENGVGLTAEQTIIELG